MRTLAALCVRRPVFTWVLILSTFVLGFNALTKMPIERYPSVEVPYVTVTVPAPGMSSEQVESEISTRLEATLGTISGLELINSTSQEGLAVVILGFEVDKGIVTATNEVRDRILRLGDELPRTVRPARIDAFSTDAAPIYLIAVDTKDANTRTPLELTEIAETLVKRELQTISGVGDVALVGGETRALSVVLDPLRLQTLDLTGQEVRMALERENLEAPGGSVADGDSTLGLRLSAKARTAQELQEVVVAKRGQMSVRLRDLGTVSDGTVVSTSRASLDGRSAVIVSVTKQSGMNTVKVANEVRERLGEIQKRLPDGVTAQVIQDNSESVYAAVDAISEHLIIGSILAALVVLLFLRSWRATMIAAVAIPASVIGAFAAAHALGITLNLLSMLGLTLAVGIVIDDAIVVLENVVRTMHQKKLSPREAAVEATGEISLAVLATTLSLVAVFLPLATMGGLVGRYLVPFGVTMSVSVLLSMAVAFTLTPMLCSRWLKEDQKHEEDHGRLERIYTRALAWALNRRWVVVLGIGLTLFAIGPIGAALPKNFTPVEDLSRLIVYVRLPDRVSVERTAQVAEEFASNVRTMQDVTSTLVMTRNNREATITVYLARNGVQAEMIQRVRARLAQLAPPDVLTMVGETNDFTPPGPDTATIQFVVKGSNLVELGEVGERLLAKAKKIPGTVDHGITTATGKPELAVHVDRDHASKLGIAHAEIGSALALVDREGVELSSVRDPLSKFDLSLKTRLRIASDELAPEDLARALGVRSDRGSLLPLADVATFERVEGPGVIRRQGRQRMFKMFMNTVPGTSEAAVATQLEQELREIDPTGQYQAEPTGNVKSMREASAAFTTAVGLAFAFMFLILAAQFESWIHPITILLSLPLTIPFGLVSLWLGWQSLNLFSLLGFLVLFGVVKKNSILQVDRIIQLRREGMARREAVLHACADRLRPILMTTLAFVAGMLPLIVSSGAGANTNRAISVGIFGGQSLSLLLTLIATPVVYTLFDDMASAVSRRVAHWRGAAAAPVEEPAE